MVERSGVYSVLVGKPAVKRPHGRPRHRWEDNIKVDLKEVGCGDNWVKLAQYGDTKWALVNVIMNNRFP
jgi:hypothetical protein